MGSYSNIKCGHCGHSLTGGFVSKGLDTSLGLPYVKCPNCGQLSKTGKKPWSEMSNFEKLRYIINRAFQSVINSFVIILFVILITNVFFESLNSYIPKYSSIAIIVASFLFTYLNSKSLISKVEEAYEQGDYSQLTV